MTTNRYRIAVWRGGWLVYDKDFSNEYPSAHGFASRSEAEQWIDEREEKEDGR